MENIYQNILNRMDEVISEFEKKLEDNQYDIDFFKNLQKIMKLRIYTIENYKNLSLDEKSDITFKIIQFDRLYDDSFLLYKFEQFNIFKDK